MNSGLLDEDSASLNPVPLLSDQLRRAEALPRRVEPLYLLTEAQGAHEEKPDAGLYDPPDPTIREASNPEINGDLEELYYVL